MVLEYTTLRLREDGQHKNSWPRKTCLSSVLSCSFRRAKTPNSPVSDRKGSQRCTSGIYELAAQACKQAAGAFLGSAAGPSFGEAVCYLSAARWVLPYHASVHTYFKLIYTHMYTYLYMDI